MYPPRVDPPPPSASSPVVPPSPPLSKSAGKRKAADRSPEAPDLPALVIPAAPSVPFDPRPAKKSSAASSVQPSRSPSVGGSFASMGPPLSLPSNSSSSFLEPSPSRFEMERLRLRLISMREEQHAMATRYEREVAIWANEVGSLREVIRQMELEKQAREE